MNPLSVKWKEKIEIPEDKKFYLDTDNLDRITETMNNLFQWQKVLTEYVVSRSNLISRDKKVKIYLKDDYLKQEAFTNHWDKELLDDLLDKGKPLYDIIKSNNPDIPEKDLLSYTVLGTYWYGYTTPTYITSPIIYVENNKEHEVHHWINTCVFIRLINGKVYGISRVDVGFDLTEFGLPINAYGFNTLLEVPDGQSPLALELERLNDEISKRKGLRSNKPIILSSLAHTGAQMTFEDWMSTLYHLQVEVASIGSTAHLQQGGKLN